MKQNRREFLKTLGLGFLVPLIPRVPGPKPEPEPEMPEELAYLIDAANQTEPASACSFAHTYEWHPDGSYKYTREPAEDIVSVVMKRIARDEAV